MDIQQHDLEKIQQEVTATQNEQWRNGALRMLSGKSPTLDQLIAIRNDETLGEITSALGSLTLDEIRRTAPQVQVTEDVGGKKRLSYEKLEEETIAKFGDSTFSTSDLVQLFGIKENQARLLTSKMTTKGTAVRHGSGKKTCYAIVQEVESAENGEGNGE